MNFYQIEEIPEHLRGYFQPAPQIGLEPLHDCLAWAAGKPPCGGCYICSLRVVAAGVARALRPDGTFWLNLGDSYASDPKKGKSGKGKNSEYLGGVDETAQTRRPNPQGKSSQRVGPANALAQLSAPSVGVPNGNLVGIPWRAALALQADGWVLRSDIIWHKPSAMPESVKTRCTKAHEYVFMFARGPGYYYDDVAIMEKQVSRGAGGLANKAGSKRLGTGLESDVDHKDDGMKNKRTVWTVATEPLKDAHFAPFPTKLIEPMILAGTSEHGCCSKCGTPYRRIVEREQTTRERPNEYVKRTGEEGTGNSCSNTVAGVAIKTLGWAAGCKCGAAVVPCVVLDPFLGTGTTVATALKLHRSGIGIELNPEYVEICKRRIEQGRLKRGFF